MDDRQLTPAESMKLIASMISTTKHRVGIVDLRISVMWAILTIATAALWLILMLCLHSPWISIIWFAIPVIGLPASFFMARKQAPQQPKTYPQNLCDGIWKSVGFFAILLTLVCTGFNLAGYPQAWLAMFFYAFIVVGAGTTAMGLVLKEASYVAGGAFSVTAGFVLVILSLCGIPLPAVWVIPVYILSFILSFIVPAFIIGRRIKNEDA